jgi:hypothetical protein
MIVTASLTTDVACVTHGMAKSVHLIDEILTLDHVEWETTLRVWLVSSWSDALAIRDPGDARAYRCTAEGGVVWDRDGTLVCVLDELLALPRADAPGAPRLVQAQRKLWIPGMA